MNKFKVGDIVQRDSYNDQEIIFIGETAYFTKNFYGGNKYNNFFLEFKDQDKWTLKPKEVTINSTQFEDAWHEVFKSYNQADKLELKKRLGL